MVNVKINRHTDIIKRKVTLCGTKDIMFDRYAGDNATQLPPEQKMYLTEDRHLILPAVNVFSLLSAENSKSVCRQFFGKAGYQNERADLDFTLMYADNFLNGNQNVPLSTLDNPAAGYSHPDYNDTQSYTLNLRGSFQFSDEKSMGGNVYYRHINRNVLNSNIGDPVSTSTNDPICTLTANCLASNLLAHYTQDVYGANLQWSNTAKLFGKPQVMTLGVNAEYGKTNFSNVGQNAYVDNTGGTIAFDAKGQNVNIKAAAVENFKRKPTVVMPLDSAAAPLVFPMPGWRNRQA